MELTRLISQDSLITEVSGEVIDFAEFLNIPHDINVDDDHIYIKNTFLPLEISSFYTRRKYDVVLSSKEFCEVLMDIVSGLTVLEAYKKNGYTF